MSEANKVQIGGDHYKMPEGGEEHWDRVARLGLDYFQGQITKYVERWKLKNGVQDLEKARHFLDKYIELEKAKFATHSHEGETPAFVVEVKDLIAVEEFEIPGYTPPLNTTPVRLDDLPAMVQDLEAGGIEVVRVGKRKDIALVFFVPGEVLPTGWAQFVFEGAQAEGYLFTCRSCNGHFNCPVENNPHDYHSCRAIADANAPPTTDSLSRKVVDKSKCEAHLIPPEMTRWGCLACDQSWNVFDPNPPACAPHSPTGAYVNQDRGATT